VFKKCGSDQFFYLHICNGFGLSVSAVHFYIYRKNLVLALNNTISTKKIIYIRFKTIRKKVIHKTLLKDSENVKISVNKLPFLLLSMYRAVYTPPTRHLTTPHSANGLCTKFNKRARRHSAF